MSTFLSRIIGVVGLCVGALAITLSCSRPDDQLAIVQGTVTIEGELAKQGIVTFYPKGGGPVAYGPIRSDGTFTMQVGQGKPANLDASQVQIGSYIVTVVVAAPTVAQTQEVLGPPEPGPRLTAKKYSSKSTTDLKYNVKAGRNVYNIDIERATQEELDAEKAEVASPRKDESQATEVPANEAEKSSEVQSGTAGVSDGKNIEVETVQP